MKRVSSGSVSECLIEVLEKAEELDQVLVIYRYKSEKIENLGCSSNEELTLRDGNWLVDCYKNWVTRAVSSDE